MTTTEKAIEAIEIHMSHGGEVRTRTLPGGRTYPASLAVDCVLGAGFTRYHFPLGMRDTNEEKRYLVQYETEDHRGGFTARGYSVRDVMAGLFGLRKPRSLPDNLTKLTITQKGAME